MKIFTEILKATPINFIVSYFSFIVQTNKRYYKNAIQRAMESLFWDLQLTLIYALLYPLQKVGSNLYYLNLEVMATIIIGNLSKNFTNFKLTTHIISKSIINFFKNKNLPLATLAIF